MEADGSPVAPKEARGQYAPAPGTIHVPPRMDQAHIRNFCIIAHIDHGKSTLADRLIERCGAIRGSAKEQMLDTMDLERERGITIKMAAVRLDYRAKDGQLYQLNLIDTPGHVDFTYEVSRALAACEGALLVVDASQGVEAQTIANASMAMNQNLEIVPVINKIDLPHADVERAKEEIEHAVAIDASDAIPCSAKAGIGIDEILEAVVQRIPAPKGASDEGVRQPLRALIYDSHFDPYQGAIAYVRVKDGSVRKGDRIMMMSTGERFEVDSTGHFSPGLTVNKGLQTGEVGFITAAMKDIGDAQVGDTITLAEHPAKEPLPGYRKALSMVFCGLYPSDGEHYEDLRDAIDKLKLNDASLHYEPETSAALGFGFRCGFLGLLHMDIARERLEREFDLDLILTAPSVDYLVTRTNGTKEHISNPAHFPVAHDIAQIEEPAVNATIMVPVEFVGAVMTLCQERRGVYKRTEYPTPQRVILYYTLPLGEILLDFFDKLKSSTKGYASFDYEMAEYQKSDLVKVDILLNGDVVDALSFIVHRQFAYQRGRAMVEQLRKVVPRQQYEVRVQAAIGQKVIAADSIKPFRKNVIAKCYGGDITRKRKLLEKQKEGKKRMKQIGSVELPQEAFLSVLKVAE
jgi:GTP-binding protein LepA